MDQSSLKAALPMGSEAALRLNASVLSQPGFDRAATACATVLAELLQLSRAAVGIRTRDGATVATTSHGAIVEERLEEVRELAAAMDEAIDQAATVVCPAAPGRRPCVSAAHAQLGRRNGVATCTIPIVDFGVVIGAMTLERPAERPLSGPETELAEHLVSLVGPVLALKRAAEEPWWSRVKARLAARWERLGYDERRRAQLAGARPVAGSISIRRRVR